VIIVAHNDAHNLMQNEREFHTNNSHLETQIVMRFESAVVQRSMSFGLI